MPGRCLLLAALLGPAMFCPRVPAAQSLPQMPELSARDRVLVVAPHPDDESLCCAGLLQQALEHGASVSVVWITAGDGFELDAMLVERTLWPGAPAMRRLGARRLQEARAAADALGVPRASQYQLGYPDGGLLALSGDYYSRPYRSKFTEVSSVPYADVVSPGASYTGANLERDLERVIAQFRPTLVLAAAPQDRHVDHSASGALVRRVLARRGELGELRYWIVHAPDWPRPLGLEPDLALEPPATALTLSWKSLALSEPERMRKLAALRDHRSQMQLLAPFMESFVRANEIFAPAP
jgi:LmbE family N-acetylglucosaminyl deacetylase